MISRYISILHISLWDYRSQSGTTSVQAGVGGWGKLEVDLASSWLHFFTDIQLPIWWRAGRTELL